MFQRAREKSEEGWPVIVFFDEMDSMFRTRGSGISSDMESTIVPQLLAEIDGVEGLRNVIVIGATNREDLIDPAILRPGRLDVKIKIERPNAAAAAQIFGRYLTSDLPLAEDEVASLGGGDRDRTVAAMIERTVDEMYRDDEANRFLEVTYQNGDKEILYFKDFASGAMIENIVRRAKKLAIKRVHRAAEPKASAPTICWRRSSRSTRSTRTCPTRPTPTTGRRSRARRASGSCSSAPSCTRVTPRPAAAGPSSGWPPGSTCRVGSWRSERWSASRPSTASSSAVRRRQPDRRIVDADQRLRQRRLHRRVGWDFEDEHPGNDARGWLPDDAFPPEVETHLVNAVLTNGARYYVDHAHPEISTPECADASGDRAVRPGRRGDRAAFDGARRRRLLPAGAEIVVYKNNSDGKGNSYGCHENYLVDRAVPFGRLVAQITPHFVTRQIFCGSGKVGCELPGVGAGDVPFQLTQRADFFEEEVGLETTLKRPIVNTRDEPHADRPEVPPPPRDRRRRQLVARSPPS